MERIVERRELYADSSDGSSRPSTPDPEALAKFRNHRLPIASPQIDSSQPTIPTPHQNEIHKDGEEDEEFHFNLFAPLPPSTASYPTTSAPQQTTTAKIRLRSPSLDPQAAGFLQPFRSQNYYFATPPSDPTYFSSTAVSAAQIRALASIRWTGCSLPWRVLHIPAPTQGSLTTTAAGGGSEGEGLSTSFRKIVDGATDLKKRTRRGKKARIRLRESRKKASAKAEAKRRVEELRVEEEREKRTRRNREKKVKKRARERAKKAAGLEGGGGIEGSGDGEESGDSA